MRSRFFSSIYIIFLAAFLMLASSCGGGGGGGGGAVSFSDSNQLHNGGDVGGFGGSGSKTNGNTNNNDVELIITGSTPLSVECYKYNGVTYNSAEELINVLSTSTLPNSFEVDFYVDGETEPRKARVSANGTAGNGQDIFIEHQYMATVALPDADGFPGAPITIPFYKRDGISLADIANAIGNETVGSGADEVLFELRKLKIGTTEYDKNGSLAVNESGDVTLDGNSIKGVYDKWGISSNKTIQFSSSVNDGESVVINTTEPIMRIENPGDKTISLDLRNMNTNNPTFIRSFVNTPENVTELILPTCINAISAYALSNATNLTRVVIPDNVETIGNNAFEGLENLQSVTLPTNANFTEIPESLFDGCTRLSSINIPDSVTTIGANAFYECDALTSINLPALSILGAEAFAECDNLEIVTFASGSTLSTIEHDTFANCIKLTSINIPNSVTVINELAFQSCESLQSITLPTALQTIGESAFVDCKKLNGIVIPNTVTNIGMEAFKNCFSDISLSNEYVTVQLPSNSSLELQPRTFDNCTYLKNISAGSGDTSINFYNGSTSLSATMYDSFSGCSHIKTIRITNTVGFITIRADMIADATANERVEIMIPFSNYLTQTISLDESPGITFVKTPFISVNSISGWKEAFSSRMTGQTTWGGKDIIVNIFNSEVYYKWNGSDFDSATRPTDWDD